MSLPLRDAPPDGLEPLRRGQLRFPVIASSPLARHSFGVIFERLSYRGVTGCKRGGGSTSGTLSLVAYGPKQVGLPTNSRAARMRTLAPHRRCPPCRMDTLCERAQGGGTVHVQAASGGLHVRPAVVSRPPRLAPRLLRRRLRVGVPVIPAASRMFLLVREV